MSNQVAIDAIQGDYRENQSILGGDKTSRFKAKTLCKHMPL